MADVCEHDCATGETIIRPATPEEEAALTGLEPPSGSGVVTAQLP